MRKGSLYEHILPLVGEHTDGFVCMVAHVTTYLSKLGCF